MGNKASAVSKARSSRRTGYRRCCSRSTPLTSLAACLLVCIIVYTRVPRPIEVLGRDFKWPGGSSKEPASRIDAHKSAKGDSEELVVKGTVEPLEKEEEPQKVEKAREVNGQEPESAVAAPEQAVVAPEQAVLEPMSLARMRAVDVTGMVRRQSDGLFFFTYPDVQDVWISAVVSDGSNFKKWASDGFCERFRAIAGRADFLDVGANIGTMAIPLASCLRQLQHGGRVIAVEAVPGIADHLAAAVVANKLENVRLYRFAVGREEQSETVRMRVDAKNKGGSHVVDDHSDPAGGEEVIVPRTTLDKILESDPQQPPRVFIMKVNVQGEELNALEGVHSFMQNSLRPCHIFIEVKEKTASGDELRSVATRLIESWGYVLDEQRDWDMFFKQKDLPACMASFSDEAQGPS